MKWREGRRDEGRKGRGERERVVEERRGGGGDDSAEVGKTGGNGCEERRKRGDEKAGKEERGKEWEGLGRRGGMLTQLDKTPEYIFSEMTHPKTSQGTAGQ
eukprot:767906-Hanusia_phi.AAC.1